LYILTNIRSIQNKLDELCVITSQSNPNILFITETWLHANIPDDILYIPDYSLIRVDRQGKKGGGVCAYIKEDIPHKTIEMSNIPHSVEMLCIELTMKLCILTYILLSLPSAENETISKNII